MGRLGAIVGGISAQRSSCPIGKGQQGHHAPFHIIVPLGVGRIVGLGGDGGHFTIQQPAHPVNSVDRAIHQHPTTGSRTTVDPTRQVFAPLAIHRLAHGLGHT